MGVVNQTDWERGPMRVGDCGVVVDHDPTDEALPFQVVKAGYDQPFWYARESLALDAG